MAGKTTPVVLITANVGSIFEEPTGMLKIWTKEFLSTIARLDPKFVALHCQEVGGKNYEKSMQHVEDFVELLVNSEELRLFDKARIYLDEDYSSAENFTALGNFYFLHESITDALIFDFEQRRFVDVEGKAIYSKNIENVRTKEKSKFPLEYFPECKWSRKGFLRTRWCLNGSIFDLVNIHLFHDVSNFVAIKSFPSVYSDTRRRALAYTLERFQTDEYGPVPLFLFGDFNFRTDTQGVVKHLSEGLNSSPQEDEVSIIQFKQEDKVVLSLGKKEFSHSDHQAIFTSKDGDWLREFDKELEAFSDQLFEFEISFPPSYPFEENSSGDRCYMKTRCPAWCDRVVLSHSAIPLVKDNSDPGNVEYSLMGRNTCMGDHKPVYLKLEIKSDAAKSKWPDVSSSKSENQGKMANGVDTKSFTDGKHDSDKTIGAGLKYSKVEIEKLACSLEALMSQNSSFSRELESNIEPDLSRCASCRMHQNPGRATNSAGGEEVSKENLILEDKKMIALLASEIKIPEDVLQKIDIQDTGQKVEKETCNWDLKSNEEKLERFGAVKRVNSASLVENTPKKEDWKNSRCNSDVSWSPGTSTQNQPLSRCWRSGGGTSKQFNRGNSRIRLISSSNSLNTSLPRLTSHHSSSDEEWFEEIEEGDDDVLRMNDNRDELDEKEMKVYREDCGDKVYRDDCGDKVEKIVKPATESISRTKICLDEQSVKRVNEAVAEDLPTDTTSCVVIGSSNDAVTADGISLRSFDGVTPIDDLTKSKYLLRTESSQVDRENKSAAKRNKSKPLSILKRLTEGRKDPQGEELQEKSLATSSSNRESFETLIVDPTVSNRESLGTPTDENAEDEELVPKETPSQENMKDLSAKIGVVMEEKQVARTDVMETWETIELGKAKEQEKDFAAGNDSNETAKRRAKCDEGEGTKCCCVLQ